MDADFWHDKWEKNEIAFHQSEPNPLLVTYFDQLALDQGSRVFLPLCGKTLDISWLLANGYRVVGAELSRLAIEQLFAQLEMTPEISTLGKVVRYHTKNINVFVGDLFDVSIKMVGQVDATYDRAALVALPEEMRTRYTAYLTNVTHNAPQLLITFEYDQSAMAGPPFSVSNEEVKRHYSDRYALTLMASSDVSGGLKGKCAAKENVWLLKKR